MGNYRRARVPGGAFFFTVVTSNRQPVFRSQEAVRLLRRAFRAEMARRPFAVDAIVLLPDHLHCIWRLPNDDADFSSRWREIKKHVTRHLPGMRRPIWQDRFWEHVIRDEEDWRRHVAYIHYNPVRHGYVCAPEEWPFSSFRVAVRKGWHERGWGRMLPVGPEIMEMDLE